MAVSDPPRPFDALYAERPLMKGNGQSLAVLADATC